VSSCGGLHDGYDDNKHNRLGRIVGSGGCLSGECVFYIPRILVVHHASSIALIFACDYLFK